MAPAVEAQGLRFTVLDCPGSVEFVHEAYGAALGCDLAVVVVEPRGRDFEGDGTAHPVCRLDGRWALGRQAPARRQLPIQLPIPKALPTPNSQTARGPRATARAGRWR